VRTLYLDYVDPVEVDADAWSTDPDTSVVAQVGEVHFGLC